MATTSVPRERVFMPAKAIAKTIVQPKPETKESASDRRKSQMSEFLRICLLVIVLGALMGAVGAGLWAAFIGGGPIWMAVLIGTLGGALYAVIAGAIEASNVIGQHD